MTMKMKPQFRGNRALFNAFLRTAITMTMAIILMENSFCMTMKTQATALKLPKDSLRIFKSSSRALLTNGPYVQKSLKNRYRRQAVDEDHYDENFDVIPVMDADSPKTVGEHISERAQKIAETFSNMWQSVVESVKHGVEAIRQLFSDDDDEYELTPEEEEQMRAAMEARAKAIEEQNEIWRNTNQL
ncbi:uncharacterized protein LOC142231991 [Haematobia irritans]|uniref:uncharacterized protein LOC142231991 n=1 Tax=Haematobia irritans TaxID=7368 RepID=UPI003F4F8322